MQDLFKDLIKEYSVEADKKPLMEKWYTGDNPEWERIWYSDSSSEFRAFLRNISTTPIKGLRLCVAPDIYLAAKALDLNHDGMIELAKFLYLIEPTSVNSLEFSTCGFPKAIDFKLDNFEIAMLKDDGIEVNMEGKPCLIADCGNFEVALYAFKSAQYPEYNKTFNFQVFENSETYNVLKPFIKKIYMGKA